MQLTSSIPLAYPRYTFLRYLLRLSGVHVTQPDTSRSTFSSRRHPPRGPVLLLLLLLLLLAVLGGLYMVARPQLAFTNQLAASVRLVKDHAPLTIPPGATVRVPAPWRNTMLLSWDLVRPLSADGKPMGEEVRGSVLVRGSWRTTIASATARSEGGDYFAPLITNGSTHLLRITVNAGLAGALDCGCAVRPGTRRVFIGYYRLYQNSTLQARAGQRKAVFRDLGAKVMARDGTLGIRFDEQDLRVP